MLKIQNLLDEAKCFEAIRSLRWPGGVRCVHCASASISKQDRDSTQPERQKYRCKECGRWFDDLSGTVFAGHHQPLSTWVLCSYFMGLNLSNQQIGKELDLNKDDAQRMTKQLREGVVLYMCFSHGKAELIPIDKKPNDSIVHDIEFGKTDGFPCQAFNTCSERKMLAFNFLCIGLTSHLLLLR